ncbi:MAG TPA: substrate-binding domain-containing protein [Candidatus Bathyarchaeia archaeon]|nr:substrate-binding domain-containing protein [Candidatus Bathyarchaeia archaeon]
MGRRLPREIKLDPSYTVALCLGNQRVIGELEAQMLRSIYRTGSYSEAARTLSLSYAFLWNKIAQIERSLGNKVIRSERGGAKGGRAELTNQGKQLLQDYAELDSRVHRFITQPRSSETYALPAELVRPNLSFIGSHCIIVERLLRALHATNPKITYQIINVGSWAGISAMMLRQADIAGIHIFDEIESTYNQPALAKFGLSRSHALVRGYKRQQCLMVRKGNPKKIRGVDDLLRKDVKLANRNLGSGTRILLDSRLHDLARAMGVDFEALTRRIRGYDSEMMTHRQVASAVSSRRADVGIGLTSIAAEMKLDYTPFAEELYDFLVEKRMRNPYVHEFFNILKSAEFQSKTRTIPGIKFSRQTGRLVS